MGTSNKEYSIDTRGGKRGNFSFLLNMPQLGVMSLGFKNRHECNLLHYLLDVYLFKSLNETNLYQNFTYKTSYSYIFEETVYDFVTFNHLRVWDGATYLQIQYYLIIQILFVLKLTIQ